MNDLDHCLFNDFFHHLWCINDHNLLHDPIRAQFLRDHFDTSRNLLLDLKDRHAHNY